MFLLSTHCWGCILIVQTVITKADNIERYARALLYKDTNKPSNITSLWWEDTNTWLENTLHVIAQMEIDFVFRPYIFVPLHVLVNLGLQPALVQKTSTVRQLPEPQRWSGMSHCHILQEAERNSLYSHQKAHLVHRYTMSNTPYKLWPEELCFSQEANKAKSWNPMRAGLKRGLFSYCQCRWALAHTKWTAFIIHCLSDDCQ